MVSSQPGQRAPRFAVAILLMAALAALSGCGIQTTGTIRPTASTAPTHTAVPTPTSGPAVAVTAPIAGVSMFSATSGWASIESTSNPSSFTGVAYTLDGGRTWNNVTPTGLSPEPPFSIILYARSATEAWAWLSSLAGGNSTTLWHTVDAGASWSPYTVATQAVGQVDFFDNLDGWLTASPGGAAAGETLINVWRTTDGGATWAQEGSFGVVGGAGEISFVNATTGFAGGCPPASPITLCVTHDAGNTWSAQSSPLPPGSVRGSIVVAELPVFTSATAGVLEMARVIPTTPFSSLGSLYLYRTTDAGMSWHGVTALGGTSGINATAFGFPSSVMPTGEVVVAATVNGQTILYQLPVGASNWTKVATAPSSSKLLSGLTQLDFVDQMTGWAVTNAGLIATLDGGVTWTVRHA